MSSQGTRHTPGAGDKEAPEDEALGLQSDRAYEKLREAITTGHFRPGQSLSVAMLTSWLQLGRSPVRDALQRLQHEGVVLSVPRRGLLVAELTEQDARDLYETEEAIEVMAARLAARNASPAQRASLVAIAESMVAAATRDDKAAWAAADERYHAGLFEAAGNRRLSRIAGELLAQFQRFRAATVNVPDLMPASAADHLAVAQAVARGDERQAAARTQQHWTEASAKLLEHLRKVVFPLQGLATRRD